MLLNSCSEENKLFLNVSNDFLCLKLKYVESDSLREGSALSYSHDITFLDSRESGGTVDGDVSVSLFESVVLLDVMEIVPSDDNSSLHLGRNDDSPIIIIINKYI